MRSVPPRILEMVVGYLTPRAAREHVLGDLQERYSTPLGYVADAASAIPMVWLSRIRRTATEPSRLFDAGLMLLMYLSVAWPGDVSLLLQPEYTPRFALYVSAQAGMLALIEAYAGKPEKPAFWRDMLGYAGVVSLLAMFDERRDGVILVPMWWSTQLTYPAARAAAPKTRWRRLLQTVHFISFPVGFIWWFSPGISPALIPFALLWAAKVIAGDRTQPGDLKSA